MSRFVTVMTVSLGASHLSPGRTRHAVTGPSGTKNFPSFVKLEIAQYPGDRSYYLLHICEDGQIADTNHETLEGAIHQAEWEFGVLPGEWKLAQSN